MTTATKDLKLSACGRMHIATPAQINAVSTAQAGLKPKRRKYKRTRSRRIMPGGFRPGYGQLS